MTKKDYELIANALVMARRHYPLDDEGKAHVRVGVRMAAEYLAALFKQLDPKFKRDKFMGMMGYTITNHLEIIRK